LLILLPPTNREAWDSEVIAFALVRLPSPTIFSCCYSTHLYPNSIVTSVHSKTIHCRGFSCILLTLNFFFISNVEYVIKQYCQFFVIHHLFLDSSFQSGNPLWLLGVDAPTAKNTYFKMLKKLKKIYSDVHVDILRTYTKFHEKKTFYVDYVKKKFFVL